MLHNKLAELKKLLIEQTYRVLSMIEKSFQGLLEKDIDKIETIYQIEDVVNEFEIEIDHICTNLIALYHPEAKPLRTILMIMKMNNDIERMGDLAVGIARSAVFLVNHSYIRSLINLAKMAQETETMLKASINAFIDENIDLASEVCKRDAVIDNYNSDIFKALIKEIVPNKTLIESAFHVNNISKNFERIADLSTNLAESTIFIANGTIIKHNVVSNNRRTDEISY